MKLKNVFLFFLVGLTNITVGLNKKIYGEYVEGQRFTYMPNKYGKPQLVDLYDEVPEISYDVENSVKFILHTRTGNSLLIYNDTNSLAISSFMKDKPVKIIIHGWDNNGDSDVNKLITAAFLANEDLNVIVVDWESGADVQYTSAIKNVLKIGPHLGKFIDWMINNGVPENAFHLIGHSLGAHLAGIAGRSMTKGNIPYITGLDPAGPLWGDFSPRLKPSDGGYVEVIHTNSRAAGISDRVGDADFYPNKGSRQPGCLFKYGCSHSRSYHLFADSIDHTGFKSIKCTDCMEMIIGKCKNISQIHMGGSKPKNVEGVFYLKTNKNKPFYKG